MAQREHKGVMNCGCGHDLGQLRHPIDLTKNHRNLKCRWSCCGQPWNAQYCKETDDDPFFQESVTETTQTSDVFISVITEIQNDEDYFPQFKDESNNTTFELTCGLFTDSFDGIWKWMFDSGDSSIFCNDPSLYSITWNEYDHDIELVNDITLDKYYNLVEQTADVYLQQRNINSNYRQVFCRWIIESVNVWKSVIGINIQRIDFTSYILSKEQVIKDLLMELENSLRYARFSNSNISVYTNDKIDIAMNSLLEYIRNEELSAYVFIHWSMDIRINGIRAIVPEDLGLPVYTSDFNATSRVLLINPTLYHSSRLIKSKFGYTINQLIQPSIDFPELFCGSIIGDSDSYIIFSNLLKEICIETESFAIPTENLNVKNGKENSGTLKNEIIFQHNEKNIINLKNINIPNSNELKDFSVILTIKRNLNNFPFPNFCTESQKLVIYNKISLILSKLSLSIGGQVISTGSDGQLEYEKLFNQFGLYVDYPTEINENVISNTYRNWPKYRGFYCSDDGTILIKINYDEHIEIIGYSNNFNEIIEKFYKLLDILKFLQSELNDSFAYDNIFGYHTSIPSNSGNGLLLNGKLLNCSNIINSYNINNLLNKLLINYKINNENLEIFNKISIGISMSESLLIFLESLIVLKQINEKLNLNDLTSILIIENNLKLKFYIPKQNEIILLKDKEKYKEKEKYSIVLSNNKIDKYISNDLYKLHESDLPELPNNSYINKYLTIDIFHEIIKRSSNKLILQSIQVIHGNKSILLEPLYEKENDLIVGLLLPNDLSIQIFEPLLFPIIKDLHNIDLSTNHHVSDTNFSKLIDTEIFNSAYIKNIKLEIHRNLAGISFPTIITRSERRAVEALFRAAFALLPKNIIGKYESLLNISIEQENLLKNLNYNIKRCCISDPNDSLYTSGIARDWPDSRGIYINSNENLYFLLNDINHFILLLSTKGNKFISYLNNIYNILSSINEALAPSGFQFALSEKLGFLSSRLVDLGTGINLSVTLFLPAITKVINDKEIELFFNIIKEKGVIITIGENNEIIIKILKTLGKSEVDVFQNLINVLNDIINYEKNLTLQQKDKDLDVLQNEINEFERIENERIENETKIENEKFKEYGMKLNSGSSDEKSKPINNIQEVKKVVDVHNPEVIKDEKVYRASFKVDGEGPRKSIRPENFPPGAIENFMKQCGITSDTAFVGEIFDKSYNGSRAKKRLIWVDPVTKTLHWSKGTKITPHKCISLIDLKLAKPTNIPRKNKLFGSKTKIIDVGLLLTFINGDTFYLLIPGELDKEKKVTWLKVFSFFYNEYVNKSQINLAK